MSEIAVTGSTGGIGGLVARHLEHEGLAQRLLVRDVSKAPDIAGASVVACAYSDPPAAALQGVETLLMVSASESAHRMDEHRAFVDAAVAADVRHVVYTSFLGASPTCTFTLGRDHHATEEYIKSCGLGYTFLRDSLYIDFLPQLVGEDGVIRGPAGEGRLGAVTRADIARVAAIVLRSPAAHLDRSYDMTGPQTLSMAEIADILTRHGVPAQFVDESVAEAYASRAKWDAPEWQVDAWVSTYTAIAAGELDSLSNDIELITGQAPKSLEDFLAL